MKLSSLFPTLILSVGAAYAFMPCPASWGSRLVVRDVREPLPSGTITSRGWLWRSLASNGAVYAGPMVEARPKKGVDQVVIQDGVGHTITCGVDAFIKHEGKRYCLATPVDSVMLLMDSKGNLLDPADDIVERMYNQLDNYFTDRGFEILHTAGFLTVTGDPDWAADEDIDDEEDTDDEGDGDDFILEGDEEEPVIEEGSLRADPIVDVEFEGKQYKIAQLIDKIPLSAVEQGEGAGWSLVVDADLHDLLTAAFEEGQR